MNCNRAFVINLVTSWATLGLANLISSGLCIYTCPALLCIDISVISSPALLFISIGLPMLVPSYLHVNIKIILPISTKTTFWDFDWDRIDSESILGELVFKKIDLSNP